MCTLRQILGSTWVAVVAILVGLCAIGDRLRTRAVVAPCGPARAEIDRTVLGAATWSGLSSSRTTRIPQANDLDPSAFAALGEESDGRAREGRSPQGRGVAHAACDDLTRASVALAGVPWRLCHLPPPVITRHLRL